MPDPTLGRFSYCWQFSRDWPGSYAQREAVIQGFKTKFDSNQDKVLKRLDQSLNVVYGRSHAVICFLPDDMWSPNQLAIAGVTGINFRASYHPDALTRQAQHEVGHVIDLHLLNAGDRLWFMMEAHIDPNLNTWNHNVQEVYAEAFVDWWTGKGWESLTPVLVR